MRLLLLLLLRDDIAHLNDCIQTRFQDRKSFGMSRIAAPQYHGSIRAFQPENATEQGVVDRLKQNGYEVLAYLVGRQALSAPVLPTRRAGLQGPAAVILRRGTQLPDDAALFAEGKKALANDSSYDVHQGDWTVAMRPLRASNQGCIECHTANKIGDTLGIVMYAYKTTVDTPAVSQSPHE